MAGSLGLGASLLLTSLWPTLALASGSRAFGQEQIPINDFEYQEACPDYTQYSTYPHRPLSDGPLALPFQRPHPQCRTFHSNAIEQVIQDVTSRMKDPDLARLFENAFPVSRGSYSYCCTCATWYTHTANRDNVSSLRQTLLSSSTPLGPITKRSLKGVRTMKGSGKARIPSLSQEILLLNGSEIRPTNSPRTNL